MADLSAPPGRLSDLLFWLLWGCVRGAFRVCFGMRIEGAPPADGAYVLAANHVSYLDPIVLGAAVRRRVVYLMTAVVYRSRTAGWFYRWNRTIPLSPRSVNREGMRAARAVLQQGRVVGIFPEGGISRDGKPMLGNPGAVSLVLTEGVPIVPVGIVGSNEVLPPGALRPRLGRLTVRFGAPIAPAELAPEGVDRRERLQRATRLIMDRIADLVGQESREQVLARLRDG